MQGLSQGASFRDNRGPMKMPGHDLQNQEPKIYKSLKTAQSSYPHHYEIESSSI
jgi:hypothetical protein